MDYLQKIIDDIECHDVDGIRSCFQHGVHPNDIFKGHPLIYELISEYARTDRFKACVKVFIDHGLEFNDPSLLAVLSDDAQILAKHLTTDPGALNRPVNLRCAYTPLHDVSLLHVCAEFNHLSCAEVLVRNGADVNAKAGTDEHGFGGQSPIFHTVNQNSNHSASLLDYLLSESADLNYTVKGLIWGKGYPWETLVPAVNPISYAMMGLLPQMHRDEGTIAVVVSKLLKAAHGIDYVPVNVPCAYLK